MRAFLARAVASLVFLAVAASAVAQTSTRFPADYQGLWWNPSEPGWGIGVFEHGGPLSSILFVYGADGKPTWYIAPSLATCHADFPPWIAIGCEGSIYQTTGPWFGSGPFTPSSVTVREVGEWSGYFTGAMASGDTRPRELDLRVTIDGATLTRDNLLLQDISGSAARNFNAADSRFTGLWWNPDESGWGAGLFQHKGALFAVLFVYGSNRQPTWYVASMRETTRAGEAQERWFEGPVFATRGTWWFTNPFHLNEAREVGTARIVFPSPGENAALSYTIDGTSVQTVIRRLSASRP